MKILAEIAIIDEKGGVKIICAMPKDENSVATALAKIAMAAMQEAVEEITGSPCWESRPRHYGEFVIAKQDPEALKLALDPRKPSTRRRNGS